MIWFTSDTHITHSNIIKYCKRPFKHIDEMDDHIINNINRYVQPNDVLWHLGDFAFNRRSLKVYENIRRRIYCKTINFVFGNHDDTLEENRYKLRDLGIFSNTPEYLVNTKIEGQHITLCHYAMSIFDKSHRNAWHLYGHSHSSAESHLDKVSPGRKSIDVGVDNIYKLKGEYRPISFDEVKEIMDKRPGFFFDHHILNKQGDEWIESK